VNEFVLLSLKAEDGAEVPSEITDDAFYKD
jgi:hypothetical protein